MKNAIYAPLAAIALSLYSCSTVKPLPEMGQMIARYHDGILLDTDWDKIGYVRNGVVMDEDHEPKARYLNGRVYDPLDSVVAVYRDGCVYSDRGLWDLMYRIDRAAYLKNHKGKP